MPAGVRIGAEASTLVSLGPNHPCRCPFPFTGGRTPITPNEAPKAIVRRLPKTDHAPHLAWHPWPRRNPWGMTSQQCVSNTTTSKIGNKPRVAELLDNSQRFAGIRTVKVFLQCSFDSRSPGMDMNANRKIGTGLSLHRLPDYTLDCLATSCMLKAVT